MPCGITGDVSSMWSSLRWNQRSSLKKRMGAWRSMYIRWFTPTPGNCLQIRWCRMGTKFETVLFEAWKFVVIHSEETHGAHGFLRKVQERNARAGRAPV